ncbi:MAG: aminotransferase class I/II-fold pyridoxal phosphate-dependent enzyme [Nocardioides sp.]|uniref:MalY/PatB family protein n=1 Tax=Nocardioides sp. TaxID=35761 RepID=UPI0039E6F41D
MNNRTTAAPYDALRRRTSEKWQAYPDDVLPMFVAEMDFPLAPPIRQALARAIELGDTGYVELGDRGVARAFAGYASEAWGWSPDPPRIRTTTDVSVVIVESLRRLVRPGEGVVITPPVYPPFFELLPEAGARVVEVPLTDDGGVFALDLAGIDSALRDGARGILLCHPHNPLGLIHPPEQLVELSRIVARHDGFVLSDEIHAPLTHSGATFTPYLSVSDEARQHGIAAESGSKAFNLAGLKCAMFVTAGDPMTALIDSLPAEVSVRTGLFGAIATRIGFTEGRGWLTETVAAIEDNLEVLRGELARRLPAVRMGRPEAGYLAWLDLSRLGWGEDPAGFALEKARVALVRGLDFGDPGAGFARMNIGCAPETIVEAVARLAAHAQTAQTAQDG